MLRLAAAADVLVVALNPMTVITELTMVTMVMGIIVVGAVMRLDRSIS
jgi:hypothetical protein